MASKRKPTHLTLTSDDLSHPPLPPKAPFHLDLPSPRTGERAPALSPLDAIAAQSRQLQLRFQMPTEDGRRISRLPATDVAREFASRPDYFRGLMTPGEQGELGDVPEETSPTGNTNTGNVVQGGKAQDRPMSHYPMFGNAGRESREESRMSQVSEVSVEEEEETGATPFFNAQATPFYDAQEQVPKAQQTQGYFNLGAPRAMSPEPVDRRMVNVQAATPTHIPSLTSSVDSIQSAPQARTLTNGSTRSQRSLAPPKSPAYPKSPRSMQSIRSVPPDSGDEEGSTNSSYPVSSSRKFSGSSGMSRPQSPFSPYMPPLPRSPSMSSEFSATGSQRRMNFSRPLSSSSMRPQPEHRPSYDSRSSFETQRSVEMPLRQMSGSTQPSSGVPSRQASGDDAEDGRQTPQIPGAFIDENGDERPTTSYTYAKFTLPRGKKVERSSRGTRESWIQKQFTWDDAATPPAEEPAQMEQSPRDTTPVKHFAPPPPAELTPPISEPSPSPSSEILEPPPTLARPPLRPSTQAGSERTLPSHQERLVRTRATSSATRSRSAEPRTLPKATAVHKSTPSVRTANTDSTDRTIRPGGVSTHTRTPSSSEMTAEEHLEIGIQTHSAGELSKSTYHLRIAAREGSPTGMLLYALACRHGWGMRPNQAEGVRWLRAAISSSGLQVADLESSSTPLLPGLDVLEKKTRKAQFALAIYELGISYMNGWGCDKDRPLAVQCYEVAGSWGDVDALAEAGFCHAKGIGVRKDLSKAAGLYRRAAEGGMGMAGNSWIYKQKYMPSPADDKDAGQKVKKDVDASLSSIASSIAKDGGGKKEDKEKEKEKDKTPGRARARSLWGRSRK
ncbi:uncharacterized protein LTR77_003900 [Saxophila tyrrhenica]|uniref:Uncharacterized protein n=1 Tax=Saxophila tyrrhenica TaxID=1690608 RepID=A0AAV9PJ78_9PEZI|nr:hypothetical protein LTR77_003900 [Saxophila tyrrhenica]